VSLCVFSCASASNLQFWRRPLCKLDGAGRTVSLEIWASETLADNANANNLKYWLLAVREALVVMDNRFICAPTCDVAPFNNRCECQHTHAQSQYQYAIAQRNAGDTILTIGDPIWPHHDITMPAFI
jgi:hypothetical protein